MRKILERGNRCSIRRLLGILKPSSSLDNKLMVNFSPSFTTFYFNCLSLRRYSVLENLKLKDKFKLVDSEEIESENDIGEKLIFILNKGNMTQFFETMKFIIDKKFKLELPHINKILSFIYNKNQKAVEDLHFYLKENKIPLDSLTYHYLIFSALHFKGINTAYNLFVEASLSDNSMDLSLVISLYNEIMSSELQSSSENDRTKCKNFIEAHVEKYFSQEGTE
jgi:hypothetical protein